MPAPRKYDQETRDRAVRFITASGGVSLTLTRAGRNLVRQITKARRHELRQVVDQLTKAERIRAGCGASFWRGSTKGECETDPPIGCTYEVEGSRRNRSAGGGSVWLTRR